MTTSADFVGAGWAFPLTTDATGGIALVARETEIEQAIRLILGTACGERPMRPEFGCRIHDHVFGATTSATAGQITSDVGQALQLWEPRIEVHHIDVSFDAVERGILYVDITYQIRGFNDPRNLVFPFYVIREHAEGAPPVSGTAEPLQLLAREA